MIRRSLVLAVFALFALAAAPVLADEAKTAVSASLLLKITSTPLEPRETAFDRSLKDPGPAPRSPVAEVLPDGSVKVDRAIITVRNPCPPGHDEPGPLPGRRAKKN